MADHHLTASLDTCHWGYFDAAIDPALEIEDGDRVTIDTLSGSPQVVPDPDQFIVFPELGEIHKNRTPFGPHILTGPIFVNGAKPGSVLEISIEDIALRQDWGFNLIIPLKGTLPHDFDEMHHTHIPLDMDKKTGRMPWGLDLPLAPFFGVMGVAPPAGWGKMTSVEPQANGGNLDNKELVPGSTLYLPVFNEGGLFSCGDGHGVQGDGEVCITAIETALTGTFRFVVRNDLDLSGPYGETSSHYMTMGTDPDLDQCVIIALRNMIELLQSRANLSRADAYMLCSLAADLRITQTVNGSKGVHMMLKKALLN